MGKQFIEDCQPLSAEQLKNLKTRQLLNLLHNTYHWGDSYYWISEDWKDLERYRMIIKKELATREHIPNKIESKLIRKERIKKGK